MDTSKHTMKALFQQLGLPASDTEIQTFVRNHKLFSASVKLEDATFWTEAQASFLKDALMDDSDWAEIVDELNNLLRG
ncbi:MULTISPECIES: DUF2789 domain-containing protein [Nitrincola]|uniref:DUF2789 domain-containing protein n=1 Tax=Nitrincola nitratireducens TaxID=1229521 RepID=W9V9M7_9GAMM|nr:MULTISPECIES: DUF2789 domain-containing protein [Nitrincola]EXJ12767.1 hypothetical protein D791_00108 [Nitrincola nitratireducens]